MTKKTRDAALLEIARKDLQIDTLETEHNDRYDFHELAVSSIKRALVAAFEAGKYSMIPKAEITPVCRIDGKQFNLRATYEGDGEFLVERKPLLEDWAPIYENKSVTIKAADPAIAINLALAANESGWN